MLNLQQFYNNLINLNLVEIFLSIKFSVIIANLFLNNFFHNQTGLFLSIQIILLSLLIILNNQIFPSFYLLLDFLSGLISFQYLINNKYNHLYLLLLITSLITITIWISAVFITIFYNNIRRRSYVAYNKKKSNNRSINKFELNQIVLCNICLENINNYGYFVCNNKHYYHYNCINTWINKFEKKSCPTCRC